VDSQAEDIRAVYHLTMAFNGTQAVRAIAMMSVAEHLADGPLPAGEIARREQCDPRATRRLLRAGVALGLLGYDADTAEFRSTPALQVLHKDNDSSLKYYAQSAGIPALWYPAARLPEAVRTGKPQAEEAVGMSLFEYLRQHPDQAREFGMGMSGVSAPVIRLAADHIEPGAARTVVDVGGAEGAFAAELLARHARLTGTVLELAPMAPRVAAEAERRGLAGRLGAEVGDFFTAVPPGDLYLLKFVLHNWDDEECLRILSTIRAAMPAGARLFVVEMVADDDRIPVGLAYMDLAMLAGLGGEERTLTDYDRLFERAGLERTGTRELLEPYACMEVRARSTDPDPTR
jgi:hypothetical protein